MQSNPLEYRSEYRPAKPPSGRGRESGGRAVAWIAVILGLSGDALIVPMTAGRDSIVGFFLSGGIWLLSLFTVLLAICSFLLFRRGRVAWVGLVLGLLGFIWSTSFMWYPPVRKDF